MAITLHPGTPADAPAIFKVHYEALSKYHAFYAAFFVNHPRDILKQSTAVMLDDPSTRVLVAVKDDEEVVGFVRWEVHGDVEKETPKSAAMRMLVREKECLGELFEEFGRLEDEKERHYSETFQGRSHFCMSSPTHRVTTLANMPRYQTPNDLSQPSKPTHRHRPLNRSPPRKRQGAVPHGLGVVGRSHGAVSTRGVQGVTGVED